jgi:hypothetical protein
MYYYQPDNTVLYYHSTEITTLYYHSPENTLLYYHPKIHTAEKTNFYFLKPFLSKNTNFLLIIQLY